MAIIGGSSGDSRKPLVDISAADDIASARQLASYLESQLPNMVTTVAYKIGIDAVKRLCDRASKTLVQNTAPAQTCRLEEVDRIGSKAYKAAVELEKYLYPQLFYDDSLAFGLNVNKGIEQFDELLKSAVARGSNIVKFSIDLTDEPHSTIREDFYQAVLKDIMYDGFKVSYHKTADKMTLRNIQLIQALF